MTFTRVHEEGFHVGDHRDRPAQGDPYGCRDRPRRTTHRHPSGVGLRFCADGLPWSAPEPSPLGVEGRWSQPGFPEDGGGGAEQAPGLEPEAERLWDAVVPELERLRLLSRLDGVTLEILCRTYALWRQHDGSTGYPALTTVLAKLARDVGLAPAARQRMTAPEPAHADSVFSTDA